MSRRVWTAFKILYVSTVFVSEEYRGKGVGKSLICEMENRAKKLGANVIRLDTFSWQGRESIMEIRTDRLVIKPYTQRDEADMLALLTNDIIKETYMIPDLKTREEETAMFQKLLEYSRSDHHVELGIYCNDRLIGFLNDVEMGDSVIELGYVIHPDFHGMGYATEALKAVIGELFRRGYEEIVAGAFENNTASIRVMKKCGMIQLDKTEEIMYHDVNHHCVYFSIKR